MAAATVEIDETNGTTGVPTETHNIGDTDMGDTAAANLDPVAYPLIPGANTYEKYQRIDVTDIGTSSKIDGLKVWRTGALGGAAVHVTNARTAAYAQKTFVTPIKTDSTQATQTMPDSEPASANLGIGGALAGALTAAGQSDYLVHQIQSDAADVAGSTSTMNYQYDETA